MWNEGLFWGWKLPPWIRCVTPKLTSQTHLVYLQGVVFFKIGKTTKHIPHFWLGKGGFIFIDRYLRLIFNQLPVPFITNPPRWFQAIQVWRWRVSPRRESLNGIRELWFKCDSVRMMMFWCYGRCGCQWEVLGIPVLSMFYFVDGRCLKCNGFSNEIPRCGDWEKASRAYKLLQTDELWWPNLNTETSMADIVNTQSCWSLAALGFEWNITLFESRCSVSHFRTSFQSL